MIARVATLLVLVTGLAACGSDTSLQTTDSAPPTLPELDDVSITVAPEDLAAEPIVIGGSIPDDAEVIPVSELVEAAAENESDEGTDSSDDDQQSDDDDDGLNPLGGDDPEDGLMPDVVCMGLQAAQDEIQDHGVFLSKSQDASGDGRRQFLDRNWTVVAQMPAPGEPIGEGEAVLSVVKNDEPNDC